MKNTTLILALLITMPYMSSCEKKDKTLQDVKPMLSTVTNPAQNKNVSSKSTPTDKGWSISTPINSNGSTEKPVLASDEAGNVVAVWRTVQNIFACSYNPLTGWATPVLLGAAKGAILPELTHHVSMSKNGNAMAIWIQDIKGAGFRIFASQYVKSTGWSKGVPIDQGEGNLDDPFVAYNANGNAIAVWIRSVGKTYHVWSNEYYVGKGWGTARQIETSNGRPSFPKASLDITGNAIVVWKHDLQKDVTHAGIWANRLSPDKGWENAKPIDNKTGHSYLPHILMDEKGNATAAWVQFNGKFDAIFANHWTAGSGWGNAIQIENNPVSTSTEDPHPRLYMAMDKNGNTTIIWYQCDENGGGSIWTNRFVHGTGWGEASQVSNTYFEGPAEPQIAFDAEGNAIAVWEQQDQGVWSALFTPNNGWQQAMQISPKERALFPQIIINPSGNALLVWEDHPLDAPISNLNYQTWNK